METHLRLYILAFYTQPVNLSERPVHWVQLHLYNTSMVIVFAVVNPMR